MNTPWAYSFGQWEAGPPPHGRPPVSSYSARSYSLSPAHKEFVDVLHRAALGPYWRERSQVWLYRLPSLTCRCLSATWAKFTERWP
jgi:hypothetical protein